MGADDATGSVTEMAVARVRILSTIILDSLFLGIWLAILWLFDLTTGHIRNSGDLEWRTAKIILGASTLICIVLFVFWDLRATNVLLRLGFERNLRTTKEIRSVASPPVRGADDV